MKLLSIKKNRVGQRQSVIQQGVRGVSLCAQQESVTIDGQTYTADPDTAYVEFRLGHAFPVKTRYRTGIHPQVVANSYRSMVNKVFNLAHIMRKYDPKNNPQDRMLGTILAAEFPAEPEGGWKVQASREQAPGIRAVAVMHKAAQWVDGILMSWAAGNTPFNPDGEWTVSMENTHQLEESGFLVKLDSFEGDDWFPARGMNPPDLKAFWPDTPADLKALGYVYVPCLSAPIALLDCLNTADDDRREGIGSTRICRDYMGRETILLLNGLNGTLRFQGVGLCPEGMEPEAQVSTMLAAQAGFNLDRVGAALDDVLNVWRKK